MMIDKQVRVALTIEDDAAVRHAISAYLEDRAFRVLDAKDGHTGLELFRRENPDVVLVDLRMPGMDGLDVVSTIAREFPDTPTIVVSATGDVADAIEALHRGAWDYVLKPIEDMAVLLHAVEKVLERARLIREKREYQQHLEEEVRQAIEACERAEQERANMREQLHQAQKMEAVGLLAGGVAHDFNNLLTVISGHAELALEAISHESDTQAALESVLRSLETVELAVEQATGVTRSLLSFSHKLSVAKRPIDLCAAVKDATQMLSRTLPASIDFTTDTKCEPSPWVHADPTQVQQIVLNLAINARDAMPQGGKLYISVSPPATDTARPTQSSDAKRLIARLQVSDTGTGMSPETQARIFEPFITTKSRGHGTGLGLSITYGIVEDHKGHIEVHSKVGAGTTFTISLPCVAPESSDTKIVRDAERPAGKGELIILAEDDQQVRAIMASVLESLGYSIIQAQDGEALLNCFKQHRSNVRLLVVDVDLPKRDGLDCLRTIRGTGVEIPAIVISAYIDDGLAERVEGEAILLPKPFKMSEFERVVRAALDAHRHAGTTQ